MEQVVFIAGTAYSGSSMLDMMLGNSTSSFSMGEVKYLYEPTRCYHFNPPCDCGDSSCKLWQELKKSGKYNFYSEVFNRYAMIKTIVDSSKDLFWISEQNKHLSRLGIKSKVILIWKSPKEFALSRYKRNDQKGWQRAWLNYHRLFLSLNKNWWSVEYRDLATNPAATLKKLCSVLSIPYSENMEHYWNKKHHMLFGNLSAKYHTLNKGDKKYYKTLDNLSRVEEKIDDRLMNLEKKHKKIIYNSDFQNKLPISIIESCQSRVFTDIVAVIQSRDINKNIQIDLNERIKQFVLPKTLIKLYRMKRLVKEKMFYLRNHKKMG